MLMQVHAVHLRSVPESILCAGCLFSACIQSCCCSASSCVLMQVHAVHLRSVPEDYVPGAADAVVQVKRKVPPPMPSALSIHSRNCLIVHFISNCLIAIPMGLRVSQAHPVTLDPSTLPVTQGGEARFCTKCERHKPPRAHHCRLCRRCVLRMDHHCPWINGCVGHGNYRVFLQFLCCALLQ